MSRLDKQHGASSDRLVADFSKEDLATAIDDFPARIGKLLAVKLFHTENLGDPLQIEGSKRFGAAGRELNNARNLFLVDF
jgi:hypothetical protein